jgi:phage terminase small subunit
MQRSRPVKLDARRKEFCRLYAESNNVLQAALGAGYSEKYSHKQSYKLLDREDITNEIARIRRNLTAKADKSSVDVVNEYAAIAFSDHVDFVKPDPDFEGGWVYKSPDELTPEQRKVVEKVHMRTRKYVVDGKDLYREEYDYTLCDKLSALNQMGRHFGIFDDKLKLTGQGANPFKNISSEKLVQLKQSIAEVMGSETIEGEIVEQPSISNAG